jgi:hypothetical protein
MKLFLAHTILFAGSILYVWPELTNWFFKTTKFPQNEVRDGKIIENEVVCSWGFDLKVDFDEVMEVTS